MRYKLVKPIPNGYAYYDVADTQSSIMPNFVVASFSVRMPGAAREARLLRTKLNR